MSKADSEKDLILASRVKEFVEWFNGLNDEQMEKVLNKVEEMMKGTQKMC